MKWCFIILFNLFVLVSSFGQRETDDETLNVVPPDSVGVKTERTVLESFRMIFSGEPGKAALYGLLLPGGGQIYNKSYWKVPLVWAADAAAISVFVYYRKQYLNFKTAHSNVINGIPSSYRNISDEPSLRRYRNSFRLDMERMGMIMGVVHILGVVEAFTDNHLKSFDIDEDLSLNIHTQTTNEYNLSYTGVGLRYQF